MEEFGAIPFSHDRCRFVAWAPDKARLSVVLSGNAKEKEIVPMEEYCGFHIAEASATAGSRYVFRMPEGREFPDPASRFQPDGVHGASAIVDTRAFEWSDAGFAGHSLKETIIYELHVGTFTAGGTFAAAIPRLDDLSELGITTVELMPVAQFPGKRNWGYDGVFPFAVQNSYGGPTGLQQFVDAAHGRGISVILDVVYNHLGPEGNYLEQFGPFFTDRYRTPWGQAINFDGAESEPVRAFFIQNALYWLKEFHVDGLRLDAVHGIFDFGARHFLGELKERVQELAARSERTLHVIAESDLNDARLLHQPASGGYGLDGQWSDDFHHSLHTLLTGESQGYYCDFGSLEDLGTVIRDGWRFSGQYSRFRKRHHGNSAKDISPDQFVVFSQNHDQVGNRAMGERLTALVDLESLKLAAGITLLSPFVPLLFMGEEYGEGRPFQYFTSHGDPDLIEAVRRGRLEEFSSFGWGEQVPDPQNEETFSRSVLEYAAKDREPHHTLWNFYKSMIALRKRCALGGSRPEVLWDERLEILTLKYRAEGIVVVFYFGQEPAYFRLPLTNERTSQIFDSADPECATPMDAAIGERLEGSVLLGRRSFAVFARTPWPKP